MSRTRYFASSSRFTITIAAAALTLVAAGCGSDASNDGADGAIDSLDIWTVYPAGSGNHQTATVMQEVLEKEGIVSSVNIVVHEGGNGTTGIAELVAQSPENTLLVAGFGEVGATITGNTARDLEQTVPIARVMGEVGVIVVPADSKYETLQDMYDDIEADPGSVPIAVGNSGGADDIFVANIAKEAGIEPQSLNRVVFSGGGELMVALLGGQVAAGSSGYAEVADQVEAGKLRILTLSSTEPIEAAPDAVTLEEAGYPDAATVNWRGLYAGPDLSSAQQEELVDVVTRMVESDTWKELAEQNGWQDNFISGDEFGEFLASEYTRTRAVLIELGLA